nr:hypothetical protein [Mycolicibacterium komanii]CRL70418.1 hypothetical protein CPGR_01975 [Mycolicibacterium komanii]
MSVETPDPTWGAPEQKEPRWGRRQTVLALGVAAVIAAFGGAAIYAATDGGSPPGVPAWHGGGPPGMNPPPWSTGGPPGVDSAPTLHGEFVLAEGTGEFTTVLTQTGTVTATAPGTVTVRSADGFTQTYSTRVVDQPLAVNDTVTVRGTRTDGAPTATSIDTRN